MENPELNSAASPRRGSAVPLILSFLAGAALMAVLYATGVMTGVSKIAGKATGGGTEIVSLDMARHEELQRLRGIVDEVAAEKKKPNWQVTVQDLQAHPKIKEMKLDDAQSTMTLQSALVPGSQNEMPPPSLEGYRPVDFSDKKSAVYNYAVLRQPTTASEANPAPSSNVASFGEEYGAKKLFVFRIQITRKPTKGPDGVDLAPTPPQTIYFGPVEEKELDLQIEQVKAQVEVKKLPIEGTDKTSIPTRFYSDDKGNLAMVIEGKIPNPHRIVNRGPITFYRITAAELGPYMKARESDPSKPLPPPEQAVIATVR